MKMYLCIDILSLDDLVFWCAALFAFRALLRASNICGKYHRVKFGDLKFVGENLHVLVKTSKTNQFAEYASKIVIVKSQSVLCPIYWLGELVRLSNPLPSDFVFRRLIKGKWTPMSYNWFNTKLVSVTTLSGLGPGYSTHSLRRGGASYMNSLNYNLLHLKRRGCWQSDMVQKYIDVTDAHATETDRKFAVSLP